MRTEALHTRSLWYVSLIFFYLILFAENASAQEHFIPGFSTAGEYGEQVLTLHTSPAVRMHLNAPSPVQFNPQLPVKIVFYALPNGSSIEETMGKCATAPEDWKYTIQHVAAQTRWLRHRITDCNLVIAYLETAQKSWPAWKAQHEDHALLVRGFTDTIYSIFKDYTLKTILNGHSGGGRFIFSYLDAPQQIPDHLERIAFIDSNYGYRSAYAKGLSNWIHRNGRNHLITLAYNDSIALYQGKSFVSATGGTWFRSKLMLKDLSQYFEFKTKPHETLLWHETPDRQLQIILKPNPERKIYHTEQVARNGFIHSLLSGTDLEEVGYTYFGEPVYNSFISEGYPLK